MAIAQNWNQIGQDIDGDVVDNKEDLLSSMSDLDSEDIDIISYNIWIKENIK